MFPRLRSFIFASIIPRLTHQTIPIFLAAAVLKVAPPPCSAAEPAAPFKNSLGIPLIQLTPHLKMAVWETRVADFEAFVSSTQLPATEAPPFPQTPNDPVVNINYTDAVIFCQWLTKKDQAAGVISPQQEYRLPTQMEWDLAVGIIPTVNPSTFTEKIKSASTYPWGDSWPPPNDTANLSDRDIPHYSDGYDHTSPAGSFPPNPLGLFDLSGNVWEWVSDKNDNSGFVRGGSWMYFVRETLLSNYTYEIPLDLRASSIGFRICLATKNIPTLANADTPVTTAPTNSRNTTTLSPNDLEAARQKFLSNSTADVSAAPGNLYTNSLLMVFRPITGLTISAASTETTVGNFKTLLPQNYPAPPNPSFPQDDTHPIVLVDQKDAEAFCHWLTTKEISEKRIPSTARYRLPTDTEWSALNQLGEDPDSTPEARSSNAQTGQFPWGSSWPPPPLAGNFGNISTEADHHSETSPVGSYRSNGQVISDLEGNVSEWTSTLWNETSKDFTIRGSSWTTSQKLELTTGFRQHLPPTTRIDNLGFRCILDFDPDVP